MHVMPRRALNEILLILVYQWFSNLQGSFEKYSVAPKRWSYKVLIGVKILFISTWIRIQKKKNNAYNVLDKNTNKIQNV